MYLNTPKARTNFPCRTCGTCVACKSKDCEWLHGYDDPVERPDKVGYILKQSDIHTGLYTAVDLAGVLQRQDVLEHLAAFAVKFEALVILMDGPTGTVFGYIGSEEKRKDFMELLAAHTGTEKAAAVLGTDAANEVLECNSTTEQ